MKKLSEDHYIIMDGSEINIGDIVAEKLLTGKYELFTIHTLNDIDKSTQKKITHSTQPLGFLNDVGLTTANLKPDWTNVEYLPLSEVKELLGVVDVEKKGEKKYPKSEFWVGSGPSRLYDENAKERRCHIEGYREALEDNKEKQFTREDMMKMWKFGYNERNLDDSIESFQPKTEWNVEIVEGKLKLKS